MTTTITKTLELHYIKTCNLHAPLSPSIWKNPDAPVAEGYTMIPYDMAPLRELEMDEQADLLEKYPRFPYDAEYIPDVSVYKVHKFNFGFEYVICDGFHPIENKRQTGGPSEALLRTRFWRMISGPPIYSMYYDISTVQRNNEYNYGCVILKQLNEGLSELHRGRYIEDISSGRSINIIPKSAILRRSNTIRNRPANYGNPLIGDDKTEVDYDSVYQGAFGSANRDIDREKEDQYAVAIFPISRNGYNGYEYDEERD